MTPAVGGIVREVRVTDTQSVKRGEIVVVLDDTDAKLALDQAEAELGRAERRVRGYVANDTNLRAQLDSRASEQRAQRRSSLPRRRTSSVHASTCSVASRSRRRAPSPATS